MNLEDFERIMEEIEELREEALATPVLVEGRRDVLALKRLGIAGEFFYACNGKPLLEVCEEISRAHKRVILLTDMDSAGVAIGKRAKHYLSQMGVHVVERHRLTLLRKLDTRQVEHLATRVERIRNGLFRW
ncbi:toprim domain-containing protein [Candidatus Pyrohabitans sp.]